METVIRVVIIYMFLMFALRVMGKREFGQLSPLELVCLLMIPELVSNALQSEDFSVIDALVAVSTLLSLVMLTSVLMHQSKKFEKVVSAEPTVLVHHSRYAVENMNRERVTAEEIFSEMHKAGVEQIEEVKWAILESDGSITIIPYNPADREKGRQQSKTALQ
jgi:uncharacterized membrane protein YcaP (DUF421 family)